MAVRSLELVIKETPIEIHDFAIGDFVELLPFDEWVGGYIPDNHQKYVGIYGVVESNNFVSPACFGEAAVSIAGVPYCWPVRALKSITMEYFHDTQ